MIIGFTGTQAGLTDRQRKWLTDFLMDGVYPTPFQNNLHLNIENVVFDTSKPASNQITAFHHGDCIGADAEAHKIAIKAKIPVYIHPPINPAKRAFCKEYTQRYMHYDYLVRNKHIVDSCEILVACPKSPQEELRSGTWSTIRYARKTHKPVLIVSPVDINKGT